MALQGKGILKQDDRILKEAETVYLEVMDATDKAKHRCNGRPR